MRIRSFAAVLVPLCLAGIPFQSVAHGSGNGHEEALTSPARQQLAALRAATAPYHDFDKATAAGSGLWEVALTLCMESPDGGMGYHFARMENFGVHDPARPQALIYEPQKDGSMRLVAVEYIFPDGGDPNAPDTPPPPSMFDQPFHYVGAPFDVWALHAWVWRHNPSGIFADWNPEVSCQYGILQP